MTQDEGTAGREGASQRRVALVTLDSTDKQIAQQAEPLLRLAFPGIWFTITTFSRQQDGDLKRHARRVRAAGLVVGPATASISPSDDWSLATGGAVYGWVAPGRGGAPRWILTPARGELHDGLELSTIPFKLQRRSRRLRQRKADGGAAVIALDRRSLSLCGEIAAQIAATATEPVGLAFPSVHWPAIYEEWRAAIVQGLGARLMAESRTLSPEEAACLLVAGEQAPTVTITTGMTAPPIAGAWAALHTPALVPRILCGPQLRAAQVGHTGLPRDRQPGPVGFLAAAAAVLFLLGRRAEAANLYAALSELVSDHERCPVEAGGGAPAEETTKAIHALLMKHVVPLGSEDDSEPAPESLEDAQA
ncbi:hypothetical protein KQI84_00985 [bacterium]|nr:hypothetical protein [bacterium]